MKKFITVFLGIIIFNVLGCSSADTPAAIVTNYHTFIAEGKMNEAHELNTQGARALLEMFLNRNPKKASELEDIIKAKGGINFS